MMKPASLLKTALTRTAKGGASAKNLWTGKQLRGGLIGSGVALGALAAAGGPSALGPEKLRPDVASDVGTILGSQSLMAVKKTAIQEAVNPSILAAGRATQGTSNAPTLNATGDLVFGMHNKRRGQEEIKCH